MRRRLLVLLVAAAGLAVAAAPASAADYDLHNGTLTINVGGTETLTMRATATGAEFTTDGGWLNAGYPGATGLTLAGSSYEKLIVDNAAVGGGETQPLTAFRIEDSNLLSSSVKVLGTGVSATAWGHPVTIALDSAESDLSFESGSPAAPISFGTNALTATAPSIAVRDAISAAASIALTSTAVAPLIRDDMTAAPAGWISVNGARVPRTGTVTLTAGTVVTTAPVVGVSNCISSTISVCSTGPGLLSIAGNLITYGSWSDLSQVQVTGSARLDADVTTTGSQNWEGPVYVTDADTLTLTGSIVITPQGISPYLGPCGIGGLTACGISAQSPAVRFPSLVVAGNWAVGGSVTPTDSLRVMGLTSVLGTGANSTFSTATAGTQDYAGGLSIVLPRAAILSGSTITIAGMPEQVAAGSVTSATCDTGPLTVIGALQITGDIACLDSLIVNGPTTIAADVATQRFQSYQGAVTVSLGDQARHLRAGAGQTVAFPDASVAATWSAASGELTGYVATIAPTGQTCSTSGALTCSFGGVPEGNALTFSAAPRRPVAATTATTTARTPGTTTRRTVGRGSHTPLARLLTAPALRGKRAWSETGPCMIRDRQLIAPNRRATCQLVLRIKRGASVAWTGRATVVVH